MLGNISDSHIKNSTHFIEKLGRHIPHNHIFASFDVVSLFTNVPIKQVLSFLREVLTQHTLPISLSNFLSLTEICFQQNVFSFNNCFYRQIFGASMGGSLSPIFANIFMEFFESRFLPQIPLFHDIHKWYRYVDDVFVVIPKHFPVLQFLSQINNVFPTITFTHEIQDQNSIAFLDLKVHNHNQQILYQIYRKKTNNNILLHAFSNHELQIKKSVVFTAFLRAYRFSDPPYLQPEIDFLFHVFNRLGYSNNFIIYNKRKAKQWFLSPPKKKTDSALLPVLSMPYHPGIKVLKWSLQQILKVKLIFNYPDTLKKFLIHNNNTDLEKSGGVYLVPCSQCPLSYIGETTKTLNERLSQHKNDFKKGNYNNAIFKHFSSAQHKISWHCSKFIFQATDKNLLHLVESFYIKTIQNFNISEGFCHLEDSTIQFIKNIIKHHH